MTKKKKGKHIIADEPMESFQDETDHFQSMLYLALSGVTPEEYAQFYQIFEKSGEIVKQMGIGKNDDSEPPVGRNFFQKRPSNVKEYEPLADAHERTLVLKIQMKDVVKPPMWREVEIPADYDFLRLHEVIQEVCGLEDYHLWQFNKTAYDNDLQIRMEMDDDIDMGMEVTHDPEETSLTQFLQKKGDKLEYVYDFGDDWIFVVEVKDILQKQIDHPICTKYKSELNAIEDYGGIWAYISAREDLESWGRMTKKERRQRLADHGFDSEQEYLEFINMHRISLDDVNFNLELI